MRSMAPSGRQPRARILATAAVAALAALAALGAGQAFARTVACGEVITNSTRVDNDLVNCPRDGLVIGADNITLDLNGHIVDGTGGVFAGGAGVDNSAGHDRVRIQGGRIREFEFGIRLEGATANRVHGLVLSDTLSAVLLVDSNRNRIEHNFASRNQSGIGVIRSDRNRLERNSLVDFAEAIRIDDGSSGNRVERNSIGRPDDPRLGQAIAVLMGAHDNHIVRNSVAAVGDGILVDSSHHNLVGRNKLTRVEVGITVAGNSARANRVDRNLLRLTDAQIGIGVNTARSNSVTRNSVSGSALGIAVGGGEAVGNLVERNFVRGNGAGIAIGLLTLDIPADAIATQVRRNIVTRNALDGILVSELGARTLIERNLATGNGDDGIDVESSSTTLRRNVANANRDLGIEAARGVVDAGGNRARGNGNQVGCLNVFCR